MIVGKDDYVPPMILNPVFLNRDKIQNQFMMMRLYGRESEDYLKRLCGKEFFQRIMELNVKEVRKEMRLAFKEFMIQVLNQNRF